MIWEITYMVDPGDGLTTVDTVQEASDEVIDVVQGWRDQPETSNRNYFITKVECLGDDSE